MTGHIILPDINPLVLEDALKKDCSLYNIVVDLKCWSSKCQLSQVLASHVVSSRGRLSYLALMTLFVTIFAGALHAQTCAPLTKGYVYSSAAGTAHCVAIPNVIAIYPAAGTDLCAQIAALTLPSTGVTIDARAFTGAQACASTLVLNVPMLLLLGNLQLTMNGASPPPLAGVGIAVTSSNVVIQGQSETISVPGSGTALISGGTGPLVANFLAHPNADGTALRDLELDGNNTGSFGVFFPGAWDIKLTHVNAHRFTSAGILAIGARPDLQSVVSNNNGGDCVVLGYDGSVDGLSQANGCSGDGWHEVSGGMTYHGPTAYRDYYHGFHVDGDNGGLRVPSHLYVVQKIICTAPASPRSCYYMQVAGMTSSVPNSSFPFSSCATIGCTLQDGAVLYINVGDASAYGLTNTSEFNAYWVGLFGVNSSQAGYCASVPTPPTSCTAGSWANITIEGSSSAYAVQDLVSGAIDRNSENPTYPAYGILCMLCSSISVDGYEYWGDNGNPTPQEKGALSFVNSYFMKVNNMSVINGTSTPIQLSSTKTAMFSQIDLQNVGAANSGVYGISTDSGSSGTFTDTSINDNRGAGAGSKGITNGGHFTFNHITEVGLLQPADSFGMNVAVINNYDNGLSFASLPGAATGSIIYCTDCNATCSAGASSGRTCFREGFPTPAWTH